MTILTFGSKSEIQLATVHKKLNIIIRNALALHIMDFTVLEGRRTKFRQNLYFTNKRSKVKWPDGMHNVKSPKDLANAVDLVPYVNGKLSWNKLHCCILAGIVLSVGARFNIPLRWGGNWDRDFEPITDQDFQDLVHYEFYS